MESKKYCSNCGNEIKADAKFCANCGADIKPTPEKDENFTDKIAKNNPFPALFKKTKDFVIKNKKPVIISASAVAVLIIGLVVFNAVWDFTKLEWSNNYPSAKLDIISGSKVTLGIEAEDKEKNDITDKIEYSVSAGEFEVNGKEIVWNLPKESGKYEITAKAPSGKTIKKEFTYAKVDAEPLAAVEPEGNQEDLPKIVDSDFDGLTDDYEKEVSKTDPEKKDTDDDGIDDGDEIALGLDPNKADSKGDGKKDGERDLTFNFEENGVSVEISGQGNIASTSVDISNNSSFKEIDGLSHQVYNFTTSGKLDNAKVSINYDEKVLAENGVSEDKLTLYYLNDETKELEKIESTVDKNANKISAELKHFSKYVIGNSDVEANVLSANILFVIDNSVSMYTESQVHAAGYAEVTGADGNDSNFKRLSLTNDMIEKLTGSFQFGVAEFSGNYVNLQKFTEDKSRAKNAVNSMKSKFNSNPNGTNIATSMTSGISEFTKDDKKAHYMILLTDGNDTSETFDSKKSSIIESAKAKDVKICTIGLGDKIDTSILNEISEATGCDYYSASDSNALDEIYNTIGSGINFGYTDTDEDNKTDGIIVADSGFITTRDGFSFENFGSNKSPGGHCYGMATFAMLRFAGSLPTSMEARENKRLLDKKGENYAEGYSLSGTYFAGSNSLYDFKFTTDGLTILLQEELPDDYRDRVENKVWMIKTEYHDKMEKVGVKFTEKDAGDYSDVTDHGAEKYQSAQLQINDSTLNSNSKDDEHKLLDAIWRLFITQYKDDKRTYFSTSPDKAFSELETHLENGIPTVIIINGNHAINGIKLIQDNEDGNKFKIAVYNNNFPGETQYIEMTRKKMGFGLGFEHWTNDYEYSFRYDSDGDGVLEDTEVTLANPTIQ